MKTGAMLIFLYITVLMNLHGNLAEDKTISSCPVKLATNTRGPPGIPGKPGSKGNYCTLI